MPTPLAKTRFDYSGIDTDAKTKLIWCAGEINKQKAGGMKAMLDMGKAIAEARSLLSKNGNGVFGAWINDECGIIADEWGAPVQEHARKAFEAVPQFEEILKLLRQAGRLYAQLAELDGGKRLQQAGVSINARTGFRHAGIANAIRDLEDNKPAYTICPQSVNENHKHGKDCNLCFGLNWAPKFPKDRVPERLITKAKKQACST